MMRLVVRFTLDHEWLGVAGHARRVLSHTREVGVVLRSQVIDPQDTLVVSNVGDADPASQSGLEHQVVPEPGEGHGQVPVGDRAQHGDPLAEPQVLTDTKLVDVWRDCVLCITKLMNYFLVQGLTALLFWLGRYWCVTFKIWLGRYRCVTVKFCLVRYSKF